jgi:hypothetical protein
MHLQLRSKRKSYNPTLHLRGADGEPSGDGREAELERRRSGGERGGAGGDEGGVAQSGLLRHGHGCRHCERARNEKPKEAHKMQWSHHLIHCACWQLGQDCLRV